MAKISNIRVAVVGARSNRQGTGEYIAKAFASSGCDVCALVATSETTAIQTQQTLFDKYKIDCDTYTSLDTLCRHMSPDIVAICSPNETHMALIQTALNSNCHIFCEKPLWWQPDMESCKPDEVLSNIHIITDRCNESGRLLKLHTQWPFTLSAFRQLHPDVSINASDIDNLTMWMSPASTGRYMIVDALPHLLSMCYAITSGGNIQDILISKLDADQYGHCSRILIQFIYNHHDGSFSVDFLLTHHAKQPRPAGYSINGKSAHRHVELPQYLISFGDKDRRITVKDPLVCAVEDFITGVNSGQQTDSESLIFGMTKLHQIMTYADSLE